MGKNYGNAGKVMEVQKETVSMVISILSFQVFPFLFKN